MAQLVLMFLLFLLMFVPTAVSRGPSFMAPKGLSGSKSKTPEKLDDALSRVFSQSSGSGGLQANLRWSNDYQYVLELDAGTPARNVTLIVDTYDNFIWTDCLQSSASSYSPNLSSTYQVLPCNNLQWRQILFFDYTYCTQVRSCKYNCSWAVGVLANETFGFGGSSPLNLSFGCNDERGFNLSDSSGYAGVGRGPLSLVSQLPFSKFSYCFTDMNTSLSSYMLFGSYADLENTIPVNTTPFAKETKYYILDLKGISVGEKLLPIPARTLRYVEKSSGTIIYTADPLTYLVPEAYSILTEEVISQIGLPVYNRSNETIGIDLCFNWTSNKPLNLSTITYHFSGADMTLPIPNFLINITDDNNTPAVCLMVAEYDDGYSYLGNYQMKNFQFIYDLQNYKLSFRRTQCDQLQPHNSHALKFHLHWTTFCALLLLYLLLL